MRLDGWRGAWRKNAATLSGSLVKGVSANGQEKSGCQEAFRKEKSCEEEVSSAQTLRMKQAAGFCRLFLFFSRFYL
jgi:hypothetical protein